MANSVDPDLTAPIGAVCSGFTMFASLLNLSVMLGNYLQQTTFSDAFFLGALRVIYISIYHNYEIQFDLILHVSVNNFSVMSWQVLGRTSTKQRIKYLAQEYNEVSPVRLEPPAPQSGVKHSTTEPLCSIRKEVLQGIRCI